LLKSVKGRKPKMFSEHPSHLSPSPDISRVTWCLRTPACSCVTPFLHDCFQTQSKQVIQDLLCLFSSYGCLGIVAMDGQSMHMRCSIYSTT
jgi:hypothetical protein